MHQYSFEHFVSVVPSKLFFIKVISFAKVWCIYPNGPSPLGLNKKRVLSLKVGTRCGSRVFMVQPCLAKGLGVGLIPGLSLLKYLLDLAIMIA
jgi:hypothetical protein